MFKRFGAKATQVVQSAESLCRNWQVNQVGSEHLLLALAENLDEIAAQALAASGVRASNLAEELEKIARQDSFIPTPGLTPNEPLELRHAESTLEAVAHARDHCRYFGLSEVGPEHLLLGIVDGTHSLAVKILEDQGTNLGFLRRQVFWLMARQYCLASPAPTLRSALVAGLRDLIEHALESAQSLRDLGERSRSPLNYLPDRQAIVHMVILGHLPDLLCTQVAFQRHLLQETLKIMEERTGSLDRELRATIISNSAQHLRFEVRSKLESLWTKEYKLLDQVLSEAEYDLIGTVIEDLWWAQSEEIALQELFDEAMIDHRRKHLLTLQKRRLEISQRIARLKQALAETIQQCFSRRSASA